MRRLRAGGLVALVAAASLSLGGCLGGEEDDDSSAAATSGTPIDLDLLVYNVEYGGSRATDRVIRQVDADVVGVLESYERLPKIAERSGYPYYNTSLQLLSKYPIVEPSGADGLYGLIEVEPGYAIPFFNEHLDYIDWGPRALLNGVSAEQVISNENRVRTAALQRPIEAMEQLLDEGSPVFLTGDFNEPSSLDYTSAAVGTRKEIT